MDSTVLLTAMRRLADCGFGTALRALHVDHRLHAESAEWARDALGRAADLGVSAKILAVDAAPTGGDSPEAAARAARYAALSGELLADEVLLTAQHMDDQAETLLLRLFRGSGPAGLAGMPALRRLGRGWLARPLLGLPRRALRAWADAEGLRWLDDPANEALAFDRAYLRHQVIPAIRSRWPGMARTLARAAGHAREAAGLLDELARLDRRGASGPDWIAIDALSGLPADRAGNAIRGWLRDQGLPVPPETRLGEILAKLVRGRSGGQGEVRWGDVAVRRWRHRLYAISALARGPLETIAWTDPRQTCPLPAGLGSLTAEGHAAAPGGVPTACPLEVRWRQGGERLRLHPGGPRRMLKDLLREAGIRPWMRDRIPLVYGDGRLLAVADLWADADRAAGLRVRWHERPEIG
jgi:tRNA(Ile)-lysidine synthase